MSLSACGGGPCDYPDDIARDGSRCGDRAASVRPGGRSPGIDWFFWGLWGSIGVAVYYTLRRDKKQKGLLTDFYKEPIKNILEPLELDRLVDKSPDYERKKF